MALIPYATSLREDQIRNQQPVDDEARRVLSENRFLPEFAREIEERVDRILCCRDGLDDLDQLHERNRIEEVQAGHAIGTFRLCTELDDAQARRVRRDDGVRCQQLVERLKELGLDLDEDLKEYDAGDFHKKDEVYERVREMINEDRKFQNYYRRVSRG